MKLKDFKGAAGIEVVGRLLVPMTKILGNHANNLEIAQGNLLVQVGAFFRNNPGEVLEILAIMDGKEPETYDITAQDALAKLLGWFDDPELLGLFGLQGGTLTSPGSATTTTTE